MDFVVGDLSSCRLKPVQLKCANKLVYCPHVWGPSISEQTYFKDPSFPLNMPAIWNAEWGHICTQKPPLGPSCVIGLPLPLSSLCLMPSLLLSSLSPQNLDPAGPVLSVQDSLTLLRALRFLLMKHCTVSESP